MSTSPSVASSARASEASHPVGSSAQPSSTKRSSPVDVPSTIRPAAPAKEAERNNKTQNSAPPPPPPLSFPKEKKTFWNRLKDALVKFFQRLGWLCLSKRKKDAVKNFQKFDEEKTKKQLNSPTPNMRKLLTESVMIFAFIEKLPRKKTFTDLEKTAIAADIDTLEACGDQHKRASDQLKMRLKTGLSESSEKFFEVVAEIHLEASQFQHPTAMHFLDYIKYDFLTAGYAGLTHGSVIAIFDHLDGGDKRFLEKIYKKAYPDDKGGFRTFMKRVTEGELMAVFTKLLA